MQYNAICEEFGPSWECSLPFESDMNGDLNNDKAKVAELKMSLDANAARIRCLKGKLARFNDIKAKEV